MTLGICRGQLVSIAEMGRSVEWPGGLGRTHWALQADIVLNYGPVPYVVDNARFAWTYDKVAQLPGEGVQWVRSQSPESSSWIPTQKSDESSSQQVGPSRFQRHEVKAWQTWGQLSSRSSCRLWFRLFSDGWRCSHKGQSTTWPPPLELAHTKEDRSQHRAMVWGYSMIGQAKKFAVPEPERRLYAHIITRIRCRMTHNFNPELILVSWCLLSVEKLVQ